MSLFISSILCSSAESNSWAIKGSVGEVPAATKNLPQFLCQKSMPFTTNPGWGLLIITKAYPLILLLTYQIKPNMSLYPVKVFGIGFISPWQFAKTNKQTKNHFNAYFSSIVALVEFKPLEENLNYPRISFGSLTHLLTIAFTPLACHYFGLRASWDR